MSGKRIELENLVNTRDLGGYQNQQGQHIKPKKLIRSAALYKASESDMNTLYDEFQLEAIVDFRNADEAKREPDPTKQGVEYTWCPIFEEKADGITREEDWDENDPLGLYLYLADKFGNVENEDDIYNFYVPFVTNEHSIGEYKKFFDVLLSEREGSVLWHCSAGKDRCGMGTVFILKALGMSDELIYEDYLLSNKYYEEMNQKLIKLADERGLDASFHEMIRNINGVRKEYLDAVYKTCDKLYGGLSGFMEQKLGLDEAKIQHLKDMYLE